jgi:two-component system response regulator FixJ
MAEKSPTIFVIDDDASVRWALERFLRSAGLEVCALASAAAFLKAGCRAENACVVADVRMQGMSGLQLQRELKKAGSPFHFIFVTAQDTEETRAEAIRAGGAALFVKPVDDQALLDAIRWALSLSDGESEGAPRMSIGPRS